MKKHLMIITAIAFGATCLAFSPNERLTADNKCIPAEEDTVIKVLVGTVVSNNNGCYTFESCGGGRINFEDPNNILPYPWPEAGYFFLPGDQYCGQKKLSSVGHNSYCR